MDSIEIAAKEFIKTGISVTQISAKYGLDRFRLSEYIKKNYDITDIKAYTQQKLEETYAKYEQEWYYSEEPFNDFCKKRGIGPDQFSVFMYRDDKEQEIDTGCETIFSIIDSEEKAYWFGFIYADAHNNGLCISLALQLRDYNHLKKFRDFCKSNKKIRYETRDNTVRFQVCSKQLCKDLTKLGKIKGKKFCMKYPGTHALPKRYCRDFVRGFLDGDGSIGKLQLYNGVHNGSYRRIINKISFKIQSENFAKRLVTELHNAAHVDFSIIKITSLVFADMYEVYLEGQQSIRTFLDFLYQDANIYLDRKYVQYLRYILPSDLEMDQIISAKLSENILPDIYPEEEDISKKIRTEGDVSLSYGDITDYREISQGQRIEIDPSF